MIIVQVAMLTANLINYNMMQHFRKVNVLIFAMKDILIYPQIHNVLNVKTQRLILRKTHLSVMNALYKMELKVVIKILLKYKEVFGGLGLKVH
jgi:hypothetical protein